MKPADLSHSDWRQTIAALSLPLMLGFACLSVAWLLPGHYIPWTSFQQELLASIGFALIALAALARGSISVPWLAWGVAIAAVVPWAQWMSGLLYFRGDAVVVSVYLLAASLCVAVGATLARNGRRGEVLAAWTVALFVAAATSTGAALWQWMTGAGWGLVVEPVPPGGRVYANLAQPNQLATLLTLGVLGVLYAYERGTIGGKVAAIASVWMGWGIVMTQSRTAWLFALILLVWRLAAGRRVGLRLSTTALAVGVALFVAAIPVERALHALLHADVSDGAVRDVAGGLRPLHWKVLLDSVLHAPWTGYGWNQVAVAQHVTAIEHPATGEALTHAHNLIVDLLVENGLVLGLLFSLGLVFWFVQQVRACRDPACWIVLAQLGAVFLHALLEYPLHYLYFLLPVALLMGLLSPAGDARKVHARKWLFAPLTLLVASASVIAVEYSRAEESLREMRLAAARIGVATLDDFRPPKLTVLDQWAAYFDTGVPQGGGLSDAQLEKYRKVALRFAYRRSMLMYARVSALNGREDEAREMLRYLCHVHSPQACDSERQLWVLAQEAEPGLRHVPFPETQR